MSAPLSLGVSPSQHLNCSEPFMHSSQLPCIRNLGEVQIDCMLNEAPDIRPVDRKSGVRTQLRSSAACIEFQAASKAVAQNARACENGMVLRAEIASHLPDCQ